MPPAMQPASSASGHGSRSPVVRRQTSPLPRAAPLRPALRTAPAARWPHSRRRARSAWLVWPALA
jgi:hypothetical protein